MGSCNKKMDEDEMKREKKRRQIKQKALKFNPAFQLDYDLNSK